MQGCFDMSGLANVIRSRNGAAQQLLSFLSIPQKNFVKRFSSYIERFKNYERSKKKFARRVSVWRIESRFVQPSRCLLVMFYWTQLLFLTYTFQVLSSWVLRLWTVRDWVWVSLSSWAIRDLSPPLLPQLEQMSPQWREEAKVGFCASSEKTFLLSII